MQAHGPSRRSRPTTADLGRICSPDEHPGGASQDAEVSRSQEPCDILDMGQDPGRRRRFFWLPSRVVRVCLVDPVLDPTHSPAPAAPTQLSHPHTTGSPCNPPAHGAVGDRSGTALRRGTRWLRSHDVRGWSRARHRIGRTPTRGRRRSHSAAPPTRPGPRNLRGTAPAGARSGHKAYWSHPPPTADGPIDVAVAVHEQVVGDVRPTTGLVLLLKDAEVSGRVPVVEQSDGAVVNRHASDLVTNEDRRLVGPPTRPGRSSRPLG